MRGAVIALTFDGSEVRMVGGSDCPQWIAADVCRVLGIRDPAMACRNMSTSEKGTSIVGTPGGPQEMLTVTEAGLYRLIFKSRKPDAKRFQAFVFGEVLPCIHKHGTYPEPLISTGTTGLVTVDPHELMVQMGETFRAAVFDSTEPRFNAIEDKVDSLANDVAQIQRRQALKKETKKQHVQVCIRFYGGKCPCCKQTQIIGEGATRLESLQFDHWHRPSMNKVDQTWPVCRACNNSLRDHDWKKTRQVFFDAYQADRRRFFQLLDGPSLFSREHYT